MRPLACIALILMMALQCPGILAQELVVTKEGKLFLGEVTRQSPSKLYYTFSYQDQLVEDVIETSPGELAQRYSAMSRTCASVPLSAA